VVFAARASAKPLAHATRSTVRACGRSAPRPRLYTKKHEPPEPLPRARVRTGGPLRRCRQRACGPRCRWCEQWGSAIIRKRQPRESHRSSVALARPQPCRSSRRRAVPDAADRVRLRVHVRHASRRLPHPGCWKDEPRVRTPNSRSEQPHRRRGRAHGRRVYIWARRVRACGPPRTACPEASRESLRRVRASALAAGERRADVHGMWRLLGLNLCSAAGPVQQPTGVRPSVSLAWLIRVCRGAISSRGKLSECWNSSWRTGVGWPPEREVCCCSWSWASAPRSTNARSRVRSGRGGPRGWISRGTQRGATAAILTPFRTASEEGRATLAAVARGLGREGVAEETAGFLCTADDVQVSTRLPSTTSAPRGVPHSGQRSPERPRRSYRHLRHCHGLSRQCACTPRPISSSRAAGSRDRHGWHGQAALGLPMSSRRLARPY
jgi:hypothetical protein